MRRLYDDILSIARNYMGPAAEDYIRRRIRIVQAGRDPETITADKLDRLAAGIDMTAKGYLSETKALAFRDAILALKARYGEAPDSEPDPEPERQEPRSSRVALLRRGTRGS